VRRRWSNYVANGHPSHGPFNSRVLRWCHSAHTRLIDPVINEALRSVTGCLRPTPANNLPILSGIQPAELRCKRATLSSAFRAMEPGHLLYSERSPVHRVKMHGISNRDAHLCPLHNNSLVHLAATEVQELRADHLWNAEWLDNTNHIGTHPPGLILPRTTWVRLNRLRTGVKCFRSLHKRGYDPFCGL